MKHITYLVLTGLVAAQSFAAPQVNIGGTTLIGRDITGLNQDFFGGIPYAEPPLGNLRLKPPVLKPRPEGQTFNATNFGLACLQKGLNLTQASEDCLTINILRPSGIHHRKLPILFWVYGGGFQDGASSTFNGSAIVTQSVKRGTPIIYVNFNYRVGPLGFPQGQEAANQKALNLGINDEIAALQWVKHNIGAFGGDNQKVTIFGESAGAIMSAILYLNSPLDQLARGVILESGSQATSVNLRPPGLQDNWDNFVAGVGPCSSSAGSGQTFDCLRKANSSDILAGFLNALDRRSQLFGFTPMIDGPGGVYPDIPSKLFAQGHFSRIPFIAGTNLDEGTGLIPLSLNSESQIRDQIIANFSPPLVQPSLLSYAIDKLLELYPDNPALGSPFNTGNETFGLSSQFKRGAALSGDLAFTSQRRFWQQTAAKADLENWGYLFTQPQPQHSPMIGVAHADELAYVYGDPPDGSPPSLRISALMIDYWISFATSLHPNDGKGLKRPIWEKYTLTNQRIIQLNGDNTTMIPDTFRKEQMDFINSVPATFYHRRGFEISV